MKQLDLFGGSKEVKPKQTAKKSAQLSLFADAEFFHAPAQGTYMWGDWTGKGGLDIQDSRTEAEKDETRRSAAKARTIQMF